MHLRIEIADTTINTRSGKSKAGQEYTIHRQEGYLHNGHKYPERFEFAPPMDGDKPVAYPVGFYDLDPASIRVGEYKDLEINRFDFKLVPEAKPAAK
ncbi:single-stranded DNA-binding protein [Pseudoxanthomonas sp. PXM04]|uniref:single-stranded DNA-binding protein n=1 Tax=Pseudoxanthomonas sp. PXM04 TaxID=2769297 RepID=UPI0017831ED7|nr:single-stranded DNA-binding protein [Pseudoxanthomonas sp. PXM04]MBD9377927.1 helix-destabilizing protein [Pseudoxanthomonas sp. PXM04]